jgi:propionate CoA-transferase
VRITSEGKARKFVSEVEHKTFSGKVAVSRGQPVLYVTERCVFRLCEQGLELIEVAPGVDIERDILPFMDFKPVVNKPVPLMDARIFLPEPMGLRNDMMRVPLESRFRYDPEENLFFINFENMEVKTKDDIEAIRSQVESIVAPLGRKVSTVVNYDNFSVPLDLSDEYAHMVRDVVSRFYSSVSRYSTSAFMRMMLGIKFSSHGLSPEIHVGEAEALESAKRARAATGDES